MSVTDLSYMDMATLLAKFHELGIISTGLFVTIISGFLVMAFYMGARLTRAQTIFVTIVFLGFSSFMIWGSTVYFHFGSYFDPGRWGADPIIHDVFSNKDSWLKPGYVVPAIQIAIVIGSLLFLRDIRKAAAEADAEVDNMEVCEQPASEEETPTAVEKEPEGVVEAEPVEPDGPDEPVAEKKENSE